MAKLVALYDACVLYPAPLRDLLVTLAGTGLFRDRWTNQIHDEWIENLLAERPELQRAKLERTRELMNQAVLDCLVEGYDSLIPTLTLPDPDDRHVLAAAIQGEAGVVVTFNLKHFPQEMLQPHGIEAQHPDAFVSSLFDLDSEVVCQAVREQRSRLKNPPRSVEEFLSLAAFASLPETLQRLRSMVDRI